MLPSTTELPPIDSPFTIVAFGAGIYALLGLYFLAYWIFLDATERAISHRWLLALITFFQPLVVIPYLLYRLRKPVDPERTVDRSSKRFAATVGSSLFLSVLLIDLACSIRWRWCDPVSSTGMYGASIIAGVVIAYVLLYRGVAAWLVPRSWSN
jgi:uncharacterized membrane protein